VTLEEFTEMFRTIYGQVHEGLPVEALALHFIEEVGEVANAIRLLGEGGTGKEHSSIKRLEREVADVFSWVCNLFLRAKQHFAILQWYNKSFTRDGSAVEDPERQITLPAVTWRVYAGDTASLRCPSCGARPCLEPIPESDAKGGTTWHIEGGKRTSIVITIDGPSGAGKSTVAQKVAMRLGLTCIDSGATYRAAALKVLQSGISPDDEQAVARLIAQTDIRITTDSFQPRVLMDGEDVTDKIRTPEVTLAAPKVSRLPEVRAKLVAAQRSCAVGRGVVMEGRDIGTVVFPSAALKVFLRADPVERARRRLKQDSKTGRSATLEQTADEIARRDKLDAERKISPLVAAADAYQIDSTNLLADQVVEQILELARKKGVIGPNR
jgi:cytidylate kinase